MNAEEWEARLESYFSDGVSVGGRIMSTIKAEQDYGLKVTMLFHGYQKLSDSFQSFLLETIEVADRLWDRGKGGGDGWYPRLLLGYATVYRSVRAAETLYIRGYPLSGYALLRDLKDRAFVFSAIGRSETTYQKAIGMEQFADKELTKDDFEAIRKARIKTEKEIRRKTTGAESGLPAEVSHLLEEWQKGFDLEMHGARFTESFETRNWIEGKGPLPLLPLPPTPESSSIRMYANRSQEIAWILLRTLPVLQLRSGSFGEGWAERWSVLDDSFRVSIQALADQGKDHFTAVISFVNQKFSFTPHVTAYPGE
jgi:hypothetical protein